MDKVQEFKSRLSPDDQALLETLLTAQATEQKADALGHEFKAGDPPVMNVSATVDSKAVAAELFAMLKAEGDAAMVATPEAVADDVTEDDTSEEPFLGPAEINAIADALVAKIMPLLATKSTDPDPQVAAIATKADDLEAKITELTAELAALKGDQPRANGVLYLASRADDTVTNEKADGPAGDPQLAELLKNADALSHFLMYGNGGTA